MSIFEQATRAKLRFASVRGALSTEDLWDLPLQAKNNFDLDNVAKGLARQLRQTDEESFVDTQKNSPARSTLELALEVVKHVIAVRKAENTEKSMAKARESERELLIEILQRKKNAALEGLSEAEIQLRLDALK